MSTKKSLLALFVAVILAIPLVFAAGEPANVTGLQASAVNDTSIRLSWNAAEDAQGGLVNHYRVYFGASSVQALGEGEYADEVDTPNNNTAYVVTNLEPVTAYYFSVTAIDGNGLESEAYSLEASATTSGETMVEETPGDNGTAPTVIRVTAPYKTQVVVEFSKAVQLPVENLETAFNISEQLTPANVLEVQEAALDSSETKVILETAEQKIGTNYIVTAGVAIIDKAGNPIVSGNTDSGLFAGSAVAMPAPAEDPEAVVEPPAPAETPAEADEPVATTGEDCNEDKNCFYEKFNICEPAQVVETQNGLRVQQNVTGKTEDGADCTLTYEVTNPTNPAALVQTLECKIPVVGLEARPSFFRDQDEAKELCIGNYLNDFLRTLVAAVPVRDTTPPENITNLVLTFSKQLEKFMIAMRWTASLNTAKDLVDQILYMSMDRGKTYGNGASLGSGKTSHEVADLEGGKEYTFKITTKDAAGNESTGLVKSIRLPQTGAAVGLLLIGSAIGAFRTLRRKNK